MIKIRIRYEVLKRLNADRKRAQKTITEERKLKIEEAYGMLKRGVNVMQVIEALACAIGDPLPANVLEDLES